MMTYQDLDPNDFCPILECEVQTTIGKVTVDRSTR